MPMCNQPRQANNLLASTFCSVAVQIFCATGMPLHIGSDGNHGSGASTINQSVLCCWSTSSRYQRIPQPMGKTINGCQNQGQFLVYSLEDREVWPNE